MLRRLPDCRRRVCVNEIGDLHAWRTEDTNIYVGRHHPILGTAGYGNPYRVAEFGRREAIRLYTENTLPQLSPFQLRRIAQAHELACHCSIDELCHSDALISFVTEKVNQATI